MTSSQKGNPVRKALRVQAKSDPNYKAASPIHSGFSPAREATSERVVEQAHTPSGWLPANLRGRRSHDELVAIARARIVTPNEKKVSDKAAREAAGSRKIPLANAKINLGRSNKKRKPERIESLHTAKGKERLNSLEALVFRDRKVVHHP